jgi:tRNA(Ile2) C34 agmatinyltransferase TiaS
MSLTSEIKEKQKELDQLILHKETIDKIKSSDTITCYGDQNGKGCGKKIKLKDITLIQTYWYEKPWGCTGGDTWHSGETNFVCPKCKQRNRPCWNKEFKTVDEDFKLIKNKFKTTIDE